jgi:hypothetical protein
VKKSATAAACFSPLKRKMSAKAYPRLLKALAVVYGASDRETECCERQNKMQTSYGNSLDCGMAICAWPG